MTKPNSEYAKKLTKKQTKEMIDVIKNTPSPNKPNNKWEIEYDGQFGGLTGEVIDKYDLDAIKLFISKTLQQQREDLIKEIEGIVGEDEELIKGIIYEKDRYRMHMIMNANMVMELRNQLRKEIRERLKQIIN
ncbi:MAG TPA: hypothetical protein PLX95_04040 [bacterium]|nr:hypothetical protein [bacterium]